MLAAHTQPRALLPPPPGAHRELRDLPAALRALPGAARLRPAHMRRGAPPQERRHAHQQGASPKPLSQMGFTACGGPSGSDGWYAARLACPRYLAVRFARAPSRGLTRAPWPPTVLLGCQHSTRCAFGVCGHVCIPAKAHVCCPSTGAGQPGLQAARPPVRCVCFVHVVHTHARCWRPACNCCALSVCALVWTGNATPAALGLPAACARHVLLTRSCALRCPASCPLLPAGTPMQNHLDE